MASLKYQLPPAKSSTTTSFYDHSNAPWFKNRFTESETEKSSVAFKGYPEDFGDGGAFPEIHVVQYPLGMGKNNKSNKHESNTLPVTVDNEGNVVYDAIVKQKNKIVYSQHKDIIPKVLKKNERVVETTDSTTEETKAAIEKIVNNVGLRAAQETKYIKFEPSSSSAFKERVIRMVETVVDPLDPPKFKHKRVPRPSGSPPVPVVHSPPRFVSVKDQQDWKIPPCISNWKNQKGYAIPLDKRVAADGGRGLQDVRINDGFAKLAESLFIAEEKAREAVSMRAKVMKEMVMMEKERREEELRELARKARSEREEAKEGREEWEERMQREGIRGERRVEAMGKKSKISRDRDRDVSERVALGMASTGGKGGEVMYDQRLFNQEKGMGSGFATDDQYNVYEKGLFTVEPTLSTLYKPKKDTDEEMYGNEQLGKVKNTERFKPDKGFTGGSERLGKRERPVEFEKEEEQDPFGLGKFESDVKRSRKVLDKIGSSGTMGASGSGGGSSSRDDYGGSGRTKINFERGGR